MKFSNMIAQTENEILRLDESFDFTINKLTSNSNNVEQNDIFFAVKGFVSDGNKYIEDAFEKGAKAVITDGEPGITDSRIHKVKDVRKTMALMSAAFYGKPSGKMKMIGVTGTNGKTTVTSIINFVLQSAGKKTGLIGTNGNYINKRYLKTEHTTPDAIELNKVLSEMADEGVETVIMEVSSHSLELKRVYGIEFDIAVFTNLTPEHLDFHKTMENYFESKKLLFDSLQRIGKKGIPTAAIYNCNDEFGSRIVSNSEAERIAYGFGCGTYTARDIEMNINGMHFEVLVPHNGEDIEKIKIYTKLTGKFNVHNILAAAAALKIMGISYRDIVKYIAEFTAVDGRFNRIKLNNGADAIIDYSHTPDSLKKAIAAIREILDESGSNGKIITVFGCGGNRDISKRPEMGKIAAAGSSEVIITSDNPRFEEPMEIIEAIKSGITSDNYTIEENRELAIKKAIELSSKGDIILIAGKGHETYQEIKGIKYLLSDKEIAEKYGK
ncbi:MAG TPA: UDP-N-acetylmuramoyl-L-alanyl-D-glutamate--2,6-diaminopimelate ligase [Ignavibacteria bacterium]|nr:UDP-N-acetylmuramoyl-L-alanyl-D-glutamate--2,6-diaminopimelate ligase [Ignavibacteria bacterium]HRJ03382.1 UDP-N-acetylmuramoyl-L-alanyl-D-glutamate--2,6-diaminopimelate ligase [Ignavibacteria bacterium]